MPGVARQMMCRHWKVPADYARRLGSAGGHLFIYGVDPDLLQQLRKPAPLDLDNAVTVIPPRHDPGVDAECPRGRDPLARWLAGQLG